jgi:tRNA threonylcarbamoyladenosine biosynthesis protein TsaB
MNILAFDTCFNACSVAVGRDVGSHHERLEQYFEPRETGHAEALMPMIDKAMSDAGLAFKDLDRIAATTGPGTFTGMRIAVSAARALALATGVPLVGASSLAVMAEDAADDLGDRLDGQALVVAVDARRGQVYAQAFRRSREAGGEVVALTAPMLATGAEAAALGEGGLVVSGSGGGLVSEAARAAGRQAEAVLPRQQPDACALLYLAQRLPLAEAPLKPLYLRPADAKPQLGGSIARR